jgi:hypothetical protein
MVVRIRFDKGRRVLLTKGKNRRVALALSALMTPAAVMASVLGLWRLTADMKLTGEFGIATGLFSHWQVWMVFAALLQGGAWALNRYGHDQARS